MEEFVLYVEGSVEVDILRRRFCKDVPCELSPQIYPPIEAQISVNIYKI